MYFGLVFGHKLGMGIALDAEFRDDFLPLARNPKQTHAMSPWQCPQNKSPVDYIHRCSKTPQPLPYLVQEDRIKTFLFQTTPLPTIEEEKQALTQTKRLDRSFLEMQRSFLQVFSSPVAGSPFKDSLLSFLLWL